MARMGRPPKPTNLKLLHGNPGNRTLNKREPKPKSAAPEAPGHLSAAAQAEWARVCGELKTLGLLTGLDRAALAAYCQAYGRWVQAESALAKVKNEAYGLVIKTQSGNMIQNPLVGTANKAMSDMMRYAAEFGMTPSARAKIEAEGAEEDNPFAKFA